jgi:predicted nucleic acid-binding protein
VRKKQRPILVDTDVLVDYLRGHPQAVAFVQANAKRMALPSIVAAELYAGVRDDEEREALDRFVGLFQVVPVSLEIARAGGLYRRDYMKSHGVGLADAIVAATADAADAELGTLNVKHYPMFNGLTPAYTKTM